MDMEILKKLLLLLDSGKDAILATVIGVSGSAPREAGTKMIITADRKTYGTIGGGFGEEKVKLEGLRALTERKPAKYKIDLTNDIAAGEGMICGGVMEVFIDFISAGDQYAREVLARYIDSLEKNEKPMLISVTGVNGLAAELLGRKMVLFSEESYWGDFESEEINGLAVTNALIRNSRHKPGLVTCPVNQVKAIEFFIEPGVLEPRVVILGGGHIAQPLSKIASMLGYRVIVVDDRPEFADINRFPQADNVICDNFVKALVGLGIDSNTYTVIVTRGHEHDRDCLKEIIKWPAAYIGMIGSRRKVKAVMKQLAQEGVPPERLNEVYSPIGLDIGAETPEEIALSIMAQVVNVYRGGRAQRIELQ